VADTMISSEPLSLSLVESIIPFGERQTSLFTLSGAWVRFIANTLLLVNTYKFSTDVPGGGAGHERLFDSEWHARNGDEAII